MHTPLPAVKWHLISRNPAAVVEPPPVELEEVEVLSVDQVAAVLQALDGRALYPNIALALATGMRRGELLALRWSDTDLEDGRLRVEQSLEQTKEGLRFKPPKTRYGRRAITLPASAIQTLRDHRRQQLEQRLALGLGKEPIEALVFANWDGSARSPNALTKDWTRTIAALKLPKVTLHALRHTHASQLIGAGVDVVTISRRLGHGSPTITLSVYGHLLSNSNDRAATAIEAVFAPARTE